MKKFDNQFFSTLIEKGQNAPRLRSNENIHPNNESAVQRLFISMEPDSYVRPHRHIENNKWEFFYVVKGKLLFFLFDDKGIITEKLLLSADGDVKGGEIPPNTWHSIISLESGTVFFEMKEGPYIVTNRQGYASWAPAEGDKQVASFIQKLSQLTVGDSADVFSGDK